jgi:hypothetical protein
MRTASIAALSGILAVSGIVGYGLLTPSITEHTEVTVRLPLAPTYSRILDIDDLSEWLQGLEEVKSREKNIFPGIPAGSYDLRFSDRAFNNEMQLDVLDIEPLESVKVRLHNDHIEILCTLTLKAYGSATDISAKSVVSGKSLLAKVVLPHMKKRLLKEKNDNLNRFKAMVEMQ